MGVVVVVVLVVSPSKSAVNRFIFFRRLQLLWEATTLEIPSFLSATQEWRHDDGMFASGVCLRLALLLVTHQGW
jgi:hypothetical protein